MAYTKQNFTDKQVLTHTHLNNIENGIAAASTAADNAQTAAKFLAKNPNGQISANYIQDVLGVDLNDANAATNASGYFDGSANNVPTHSMGIAFGIREVIFVRAGFVIVEANCFLVDSTTVRFRNTFNLNVGGWIGWSVVYDSSHKPTPYDIGNNDFVVAQGTSDIWSYRMWDSGIAECWGAINYSFTGNSSAADRLDFNKAFPFTFTTFPNVVCDITNLGGWAQSLWYTGYSTSSFDCVYIHGDPNRAVSGTLIIHAVGRWK